MESLHLDEKQTHTNIDIDNDIDNDMDALQPESNRDEPSDEEQ